MNLDPDAVLSISLFDADAKVLIEMQAEDLRQKSSPGQANQMGLGSIQLLPLNWPHFKIKLSLPVTELHVRLFPIMILSPDFISKLLMSFFPFFIMDDFEEHVTCSQLNKWNVAWWKVVQYIKISPYSFLDFLLHS